MIDFARLGIHLPHTSQASTNVKTFCPKCHNTRRDRRDKSLSVNIRTGLYHCHYCGFSGSAEVVDGSDGQAGHLWQRPQRIAKTDYKTPAPKENAAPGEKVLAWFRSRGISHRDRSVGNVLVKVEKVKFRHLGNTGKARLSYNLANGRYAAYAADGKTEWDDTNHLAALRHERESEVKANAHFPESWFADTEASSTLFGSENFGIGNCGLPDMPGFSF